RGYLTSAASFLNQHEIDNLAFSGKVITFETGLRFLTDYLEGDVYFKCKQEDHNLIRCRTQKALVESIDAQEEAMNAVVENFLAVTK
ncbi:MAG: mucin desulfatase, partial [Lentisphaeraceae bacterium]|nr:mucin desulfatase [Lentisphaeraceae bacterium]